ncbi:helix-turn-helix domain-containing protein [Moraxellaceae bacterium AER2_44_116]|nr:helix-turn-helix domain-containing protein [Moraxellaceae bacterium AER2_44_116]
MNTFEIGERVRELRKKHKMTQAEVARKIGVSSPTITQWENNQTSPKGDNLLRLSQVLSCSPDWLMSGKGHPNDIHENVEAAPRLKGLVPVINEVQAGAWTDIKTGFDESEIHEWIPTLQANSRYAFALRVVGDSMANTSERRSLSEGMIVVVDPEKQAKHRSIVVARLADSDKATVKELVIDGDRSYLRPFNSQYQIIPITEGMVIIGTVVSASLDLT